MFDVVMPLFNKEDFVGATIESVLAQSYADWHLFVVDDGSSDGGGVLVRRFDDPRITLIEQENRGVGPARNAGIAAGKAEWIAFVDADDVWNEDHLAELDCLRTQFADAALIGCAFRRFSEGIDTKTGSAGHGRRGLVRYFAECARGRELLVTSSAAVRRSVLNGVGAFEDLPGNEDVELWARLALVGPVAISSRQTVNYRVDTGGITDKGMSGRMSDSRPIRREELSSTIPTLDRALPSVSDPRLRDDIIAYTDSRVGVRLAAAVSQGDFAYARQLLPLFQGVPKGQARVAAFIARLPQPLARAVVSIGRTLKRSLTSA